MLQETISNHIRAYIVPTDGGSLQITYLNEGPLDIMVTLDELLQYHSGYMCLYKPIPVDLDIQDTDDPKDLLSPIEVETTLIQAHTELGDIHIEIWHSEYQGYLKAFCSKRMLDTFPKETSQWPLPSLTPRRTEPVSQRLGGPMLDTCPHISRSFSHIEHTRNGDMYLYVCHDCQKGFLSTQVPTMDDLCDDYSGYDVAEYNEERYR